MGSDRAYGGGALGVRVSGFDDGCTSDAVTRAARSVDDQAMDLGVVIPRPSNIP